MAAKIATRKSFLTQYLTWHPPHVRRRVARTSAAWLMPMHRACSSRGKLGVQAAGMRSVLAQASW
jgi:hypothetical protein